MDNEPKTLQQAILYFSKPENCRLYMVARRWPNGVVCPRCSSANVAWQPKYNRWQCNVRHDRRQFTAKTGTVFEDSPLGLDKWLTVVWMVVTCKNGVSSYEVHRDIKVTQKTAWFMLHRVRLALRSGSFSKLKYDVEVDETFIGGKARNMHTDKRREKITGVGPMGKVAVMGLLERHGEVRLKVVPNVRRHSLHREIRENVEVGSNVFTDALHSYQGLDVDAEYIHRVIDHAEAYARGHVHTNGLENFWSLLKRGLKGTYVSVEPFHLFRYLDEQAFRYNNRKDLDDAGRFDLAIRQIVGKRLTYKQLIGKAQDTTCPN